MRMLMLFQLLPLSRMFLGGESAERLMPRGALMIKFSFNLDAYHF